MYTYIPSGFRSPLIIAALVLPMALSGCGSNKIVKEAEKHANAACACTTFDCTLKHTKFFNKTFITQAGELKAMSAKDQASYKAARVKNSTCQNKLRP